MAVSQSFIQSEAASGTWSQGVRDQTRPGAVRFEAKGPKDAQDTVVAFKELPLWWEQRDAVIQGGSHANRGVPGALGMQQARSRGRPP